MIQSSSNSLSWIQLKVSIKNTQWQQIPGEDRHYKIRLKSLLERGSDRHTLKKKKLCSPVPIHCLPTVPPSHSSSSPRAHAPPLQWKEQLYMAITTFPSPPKCGWGHEVPHTQAHGDAIHRLMN